MHSEMIQATLEEQVGMSEILTEPRPPRAVSKSCIRVMLADDHELIRQGLRAILELEDDIIVIGEAVNGLNLVRGVEAGARPDVVLMDLQMPEMGGVEATACISKLLPDTTIIGLTAVDEETSRHQMLQAGASEYVIKSAAADELVHTIRTATAKAAHRHSLLPRANRHFKEQTAETGLAATESVNRDSARENSKSGEDLTQREQDVMHTLMQGYSNKEIARRLVISERTVQTHLSNIFSKMNVSSRTEAVVIAMRYGWVKSEDYV